MLFTAEIDEDWFEVLDSLIQMTLRGPKASPEEALAIIVFFQFKLQRLKMVPKGGTMFPYDLEPPEPPVCVQRTGRADYWEGYEEVQESPYLNTEIEEHLIPRCWSCGTEAEEWDTACFKCGGPVG